MAIVVVDQLGYAPKSRTVSEYEERDWDWELWNAFWTVFDLNDTELDWLAGTLYFDPQKQRTHLRDVAK